MPQGTTKSQPRKRASTISKIGRFFSSSNTGSTNGNTANIESESRSHSANSSRSTNIIASNNNDNSSRKSGMSNDTHIAKNSMNCNTSISSGNTNNINNETHTHMNMNIPISLPKSEQNTISESSISRASSVRTTATAGTKATSTSRSTIRFRILSDGTHEHYLRRVKRQEKLTKMVKAWIGGGNNGNKRLDSISAVPNIFSSNNLEEIDSQLKTALKIEDSNGDEKNIGNLPPSLFLSYVNEKQSRENKNSSNITQPIFNKNDKDRHEESFFEKYGICQEVIGRGAFGIVRISHKKTNNDEALFAVKEFTKKTNEPDSKYSKRLTYEFCISSSLKHTNIINAFDLFKDSKGEYCEVMEYCSGGDLYSLIVCAGKLEYIEADCFFKQIMRGVHYMHNMGVSHRDLKPENILLTQYGHIKITDFGSAECFKTAWEDEVQLSNGIKGSSPYIAPEEYVNGEFDPRFVDVWSCGVIYMAMRTGRQLWKEASPDDEFYREYVRKRKCEKGYEPIEMLKRARCRNVIYSILDPNPSRRITTVQVLNSEWVREIVCCQK